jgi:hypothetical protein
MSKSVELTEGCHEFLKEYKENGSQRAISAAAELAIDLEVEPEFQSVKRIQYVKCHFDYEAHDGPIMTPEKKYEIELFNAFLDTALMSIKERFEQLHQHTETWGFLYTIKELPKKEELIKHCANLQLALTVDSDADIEGAPLCDKLNSIKKFRKILKIPCS